MLVSLPYYSFDDVRGKFQWHASPSVDPPRPCNCYTSHVSFPCPSLSSSLICCWLSLSSVCCWHFLLVSSICLLYSTAAVKVVVAANLGLLGRQRKIRRGMALPDRVQAMVAHPQMLTSQVVEVTKEEGEEGLKDQIDCLHVVMIHIPSLKP